ncbi:helix-turn-helix domain-containing protein [Lactiplantibacillus herbarum]|uniref:helix-turn-helix domain-containing protein n=1 Tax=Lactiplantibacillus herbarum TaxID=1670446 RepID=UPI00064FD5B8|nr:helix-turn-helix domain-containing protein [Lactiplantibacillus herbarum]
MTKYSSIFKITVVQEYQLKAVSFKTLGQKYDIDPAMIRKWFYLAEAQGLEALKIKKQYQKYSLDEKLAVVDYYQTHEEGLSKVAARFNLNPSQVTVWTRIFNEQGAVGLRPKRKGRPSTMPKKPVAKNLYKLTPTEKETLIAENMKLRAELHQAQMERDFLKKLRAVSKNKHLPTKRQ